MKFTYYTIIGKDVNLLEGHLNNVVYYAGFDRIPDDKELIVIVYENQKIPLKVTNRLHRCCEKYGARVVPYKEPTDVFIQNLYACWNLGYEASTDGHVFRGGSDQFFSKDSFVSLYNVAEELGPKNVLQANTIENSNRSPRSRHFREDFGDSFENFKLHEFEEFCAKINKDIDKEYLTIQECLDVWGKPDKFRTSLGMVDRTDGCSWLMSKQDWKDFGPLPVIQGGITGDVIIHDKMQQAGYNNYMVRDCITYHFVRGESLAVYGQS